MFLAGTRALAGAMLAARLTAVADVPTPPILGARAMRRITGSAAARHTKGRHLPKLPSHVEHQPVHHYTGRLLDQHGKSGGGGPPARQPALCRAGRAYQRPRPSRAMVRCRAQVSMDGWKRAEAPPLHRSALVEAEGPD